MAVQVLVNGVDVSALHKTQGFAIRNTGLGIVVADCSFVDVAGTAVINLEHVMRILDGAVEIFEGPIRWREREAVMDPMPSPKKTYAVKAQDFTSYLADDVIDVPTVRTGSRTDKAEVEYLVTTFSTKGITGGTPVVSTGTISRDIDYTGMNLYEALEEASKWLGTRFYVDSNLVLHWFVNEVAASSFNLSDAPNGSTTFGYRKLRMQDDSAEYANAVFVTGTGISGWRPSPPPAGATRRAISLRDASVTTQAQLDAAGDAALAKYGIVGPITLETFTPGLKAGNTVQLTNALWGLAAVTYNILQVETSYNQNTNSLVYKVTLNSKPVDLGSMLSSGQQQTTVIAAAIPTASEIAVDLTAGGANLVPNSSFEDGTAWAVGTNWVIGFNPGLGLAFQGNKEARGTPVVAGLTPLASPLIKVVRTDDYWFSAYVWMRAYTSGSFRVKLVEYDNALNVLATNVIATITATHTNWTRYSKRFGANSQFGRTAFHANTTQVGVEFDMFGTGTLTVSVDGVQLERGMLLTAYAPAPYELAEGSVTTTKIADDAITTPKVAANAIVAGKIAADAVAAENIMANAITAAKIAAGSITADKLAAILVLASTIKTAESGKRVELDDGGIVLYDSSGGILVRIPTTTDPVYVKGQVEASSLVAIDTAELRGETTLNAGSEMTAQVGVVNPTSAPVIVASTPSLSLTSSPAQPGAGLCYDPAGGAGGATPSYWIGADPTIGNLLDLAYEYNASTGALLRTLRKTGTTSTATTTVGATSHVSDGADADAFSGRQVATPLTIPGGLENPRVTKVGFWATGYNGGTPTVRGSVWSNGNTKLGETVTQVLPDEGSLGIGKSNHYNLNMTAPLSVSAGSTYRVGWFRSSSEGFQWDRDDGSSKTTYRGDGAGGNLTNISTDTNSKPNVYLTVEYDVDSSLEGTVGKIVGVARQGTFIWVLDSLGWLFKYNQADLTYVGKFDMTSRIAVEANAGLFFDGTNLIITAQNGTTGTDQIRFVKVNTSGAWVSDLAGSGFNINGSTAVLRGGYLAGGYYHVSYNGVIETWNSSTGAWADNKFGTSAESAGGCAPGASGNGAGWSVTNLAKVWLYTGWMGNSTPQTYWVGYTWYDITGTTHETAISPRTSVSITRRRQLTITTPGIPAGGSEPADRVRVYMIANASDPGGTGYKLQVTDAATSRVFQTYNGAGAANPASNNFPLGSAAMIRSANAGWTLRGNGFISFGGTSFPSGAVSGDHYYRTDLDMWFFYDGSRWLSVTLFTTVVGERDVVANTTGIAASTAAVHRGAVPPLLGGSDIWLDKMEFIYFINGGTALSGSHQWTVDMQKLTSGGTATTIVFFTINSGTLGVWRRETRTIAALLGAGHYNFSETLTKTGTPGNYISLEPVLSYRIVAT